MNDREIINKRVELERFKGKILDEIYSVEGCDEDDVSYDECVQTLLQIIDILQVHKGHEE